MNLKVQKLGLFKVTLVPLGSNVQGVHLISDMNLGRTILQFGHS